MLVLPTCVASTTFRFISDPNLEVCMRWLKSPLLELKRVTHVDQLLFDVVFAIEVISRAQ